MRGAAQRDACEECCTSITCMGSLLHVRASPFRIIAMSLASSEVGVREAAPRRALLGPWPMAIDTCESLKVLGVFAESVVRNLPLKQTTNIKTIHSLQVRNEFRRFPSGARLGFRDRLDPSRSNLAKKQKPPAQSPRCAWRISLASLLLRAETRCHVATSPRQQCGRCSCLPWPTASSQMRLAPSLQRPHSVAVFKSKTWIKSAGVSVAAREGLAPPGTADPRARAAARAQTPTRRSAQTAILAAQTTIAASRCLLY